MNEQLPAPDFNTQEYERPNLKWSCGRGAAGSPCRPGPTLDGRCGADFECSPALTRKSGEAKVQYRCTRPQELGGPCPGGPGPDGRCGRPLAKCSPLRSLRSRRGRLTWFISILTAAALLLGLSGPWRGRFINPGEISHEHSGPAFLRMAGATNLDDQGCRGCHRAATAGLAGWTESALRSDPGPFDFKALASAAPANMSGIQKECLHCHAGHDLHQPNIAKHPSCISCHQEHRGRTALARFDGTRCVECHGDARAMQAAAELGKSIPPHHFDRPVATNLVLFRLPRPERGLTQPFRSFWSGHPDFQLKRDQMRETNTLRFNHQLHLGDSVRRGNGATLRCEECHQIDVSGNFRQKVSYLAHCRECHTGQFDTRNPDLTVPHGDPAGVRAFVHSLRKQYTDLAVQQRGLRAEGEVRRFVEQQEQALLQEFGSLQAIEERIFFQTKRGAPTGPIGARAGPGVAIFNGCADCHEVTPGFNAPPRVRPPVIPDRWLFHAPFDHRQHAAVNCAHCHAAAGSRDTADVLMPGIASCTSCHRPEGGARHDCLTCHQYHR